MRFQYTGLSRNREEVEGVLEAEDEVEARMRLRAMQINPTSLQEKQESLFQIPLNFGFGGGIPLKQILLFTRQFSSLVDSGVPILQCLDILFEQEKKGRFKEVLRQVKEHIEAGGALADGLAKHPKIFSDFFIKVVEAGELSGTLDTALRRVGQQLEKLGKLRSKVVSALTYPAITFVIAIGVVIFMLVKVIPSIAQLYADNSAKLPEITLFVLGLSRWFESNIVLLLGGFGALGFGGAALWGSPDAREILDPLILKVPLFGTLIKKSTIARFARTMSTLISSGVPLLSSFEICERLVSNRAVQKLIKSSAAAVSEGKSIAQGLSVSELFPPMVIHMVNIGEMTGKLDELLTKVADIYDDEVDDAVNAITSLLQPLMIVVIGGIIMFLLIAMYLPVFQLAEKASGGG